MRQRQRAIFLIITFILAIYLISFRAKRSSKQLTVKPDLLEGFVSFLKNSADKEEKATLIKTLQFMLEERDAENEELVEFVRSLIHKPFAGTERNLNNKERTDFSQIGQSRYIDGLLASQRDGFYVEAGGFDGEAHSNSLFFELNRNWTGILIEPSKKNFKKLIAKKRRIYALNACITDRVVVGKFRSFEAGDLSGLEETMSEGHLERGESQLNAFVPCFSLLTILKAINVAKVDYFSLDVEGITFGVFVRSSCSGF